MKNVLIIGGSYFAGRVCVEEMVRRPDLAVHVFNRGRQPLNMTGVTELRGDREDPDQIRSAIPALDWDCVIDFCAYSPSDIDTLLTCLPGTVRQYVFISTTSVLQSCLDLPFQEDGPTVTRPDIAAGAQGDYAWQKRLAEEALRRRCEHSTTAFTILRPAIIYGFYNYAPRESYFFDLLCDRQPFVIPSGTPALFSFIWVVDLARLVIRCIGDERTFGQVFNLASDEHVSYARIVEVLAEITGREIVPVRLTPDEIDRQGIPLPFPLNEHLLYSGAKIQRLFDFSYTPFKQGLRETLAYYLKIRKQRKLAIP